MKQAAVKEITDIAVSLDGYLLQALLEEARDYYAKKDDPFYGETNMRHINEAIAQIEAGLVTRHDLIEVDDEFEDGDE